jgi:Transglycosylase SLT domain
MSGLSNPFRKTAPAIVALGLCLLAPAIGAEVLELGPDGQVVRMSGPLIITRAEDQLQRQPILDPGFAQRGADAALGGRGATVRKAALTPYLEAAGDTVFLSPALLEAVAWAESRFRVDARSPKGAVGPMQLMPATAAELRVDAADLAQNVRGGAVYLRQMLVQFDGDLELALAAYNAGPGAVRRFGGVPPYKETQLYVSAVLDYMARHASVSQETGMDGK